VTGHAQHGVRLARRKQLVQASGIDGGGVLAKGVSSAAGNKPVGVGVPVAQQPVGDGVGGGVAKRELAGVEPACDASGFSPNRARPNA
jgi:hypothetical protein